MNLSRSQNELAAHLRANGLYTESLASAITQSSHEAHDRMREFFENKKRKV